MELTKPSLLSLGIDASNLRAGGGVTHLVEFLRAAHPGEHGIKRIVVWTGRNTYARLPNFPWIERVHVPLLDRALPFRLYWQTIQLSKLARRSCDVLFVPGGSYQGAFGPVVTMCRNLLPFEEYERQRYGMSCMRLKLRLLELSQSSSFRHADGLIFLTEYARNTVLHRIGSLRCQQALIPHGIDERFRLPPRPQRSIGDYSLDKPFRFLYVSIVDVYKHQWQVVEAVAQLKKEGLPVELELVGPAYLPAMRLLRQAIANTDPEERYIHYRGSIPYSDLPKYYHRADAFVFASSCENLPNTLLEAMAAGLPVACSNRGPMSEILGASGEYFDPEQPEQIAQALQSLMENPNRRRACAQVAFERAQDYSWERCARDTLDLIVNIAESFSRK